MTIVSSGLGLPCEHWFHHVVCSGGNSENRQVELAEARRLGDDVSLNNLSSGDREAEYSGQLAIWCKYNSDRAVNQSQLGRSGPFARR
jgi:hypothetical protein